MASKWPRMKIEGTELERKNRQSIEPSKTQMFNNFTAHFPVIPSLTVWEV